MATREDQLALLEKLGRIGSAGRAEGESSETFPHTFHPVPQHLRAFDPDVVLIVGPRGAGKTELFRAGIEMDLLPAVAAYLPELRLPPLKKTTTGWYKGYPIGAGFPDDLGLSRFVHDQGANEDTLLEVWFAFLVRVLRDEIRKAGLETSAMLPLFEPPGGDVAAVLAAFRRCGPAPLVALDQLDERLGKEGRFLFVGYDELDTLGKHDWTTITTAVAGLVGLWATRSRRWTRIRAKIFLRTDLFERAGATGGADFAKLAANRTEISWSDADLYAMLLKRIANTHDDLRGYCETKLAFKRHDRLGWIPLTRKPTDARVVIERLIGPYMGANERKGLTFRWLLDHVRDGRGHALPRPLVKLVEIAADLQRASGACPRWPRLLEPRALRRALDRVSEDTVAQTLDEWPWLEGLKIRLKVEREVPWERRTVDRLLMKAFDDPWAKNKSVRPPAANGREFVDYLIEVGVFRARPDGRVDVPDLFLSGLGLKRKGGVVQS